MKLHSALQALITIPKRGGIVKLRRLGQLRFVNKFILLNIKAVTYFSFASLFSWFNQFGNFPSRNSN